MPIIYLSPSTQENNLYVNGGTEEQWMNRLADAGGGQIGLQRIDRKSVV